MDRDSFYIGALMHDIGKFLERSKDYQIDRDWSKITKYGHPKYSAQFFKNNLGEHPLCTNEALNLALFHHESDLEDQYCKLVQIADRLSPAERQKYKQVENVQAYYESPLVSIFTRLHRQKSQSNDDKLNFYLPLEQLCLDKDKIFPSKGLSKISPQHYKEMKNNFLEEFNKIKNENQLYALLEKYTWSIPSATPTEFNGKKHLYIPDVSLFDHSRTTAAIALCLYDQLIAGDLNKETIKQIQYNKYPDESNFLLVMADFSGVQEFIYSISSKKAARSLKGRSFFLDLLAEAIAHFFITQLDLKQANLLYNGGGNFFLLVPLCKEDKLQYAYQYVSKLLLKAYYGKIYLSFGKTKLNFSDFHAFGEKWYQVSQDANKSKAARFKEIEYQEVFEPFERKGLPVCGNCQVESAKLAAIEEDDDDTKWCPMCISLEKLTAQVKDIKYLCFKNIVDYQLPDWKSFAFKQEATIQDIFMAMGLELIIDTQQIIGSGMLRLNSTAFIPADGFKFAVVQVPTDKNSRPIDFDHIAKIAEGADKLALLKIDVDNLGELFIKGLPKEEKSISRIASLSRQLRLFFEGFLNTILEDNKFANKIYTVYSGGDDTFLIGPWNLTLDLAGVINKHFREYTCNNDKITISASLTIIDAKFPIIRAAALAEENLHKAKTYKDNEKNKIAIFEQVFSWDEFTYILSIKELLVDLIKEKGESRAILQKILNSTKGFEKLMQAAGKGKINNEKVWRFAYFLRTIDKKNKAKAEELLQIYENILLHNLFKAQKIENIMMLPVACRLAELATKKS